MGSPGRVKDTIRNVRLAVEAEKVLLRSRSCTKRCTSTSAMAIWVSKRKRSVSASIAPFSAIREWPAQTVSVVDSSGPAPA